MNNSYIDETGVERLECPICHRKGFSMLQSHFARAHKGIKYPEDTIIITEECRARRSDSISEGVKVQWSRNYERMREVTSRSLANYRETEEYHKAKSEMMTRLNSEGVMGGDRGSRGRALFNKLWSSEDWKAWKSKHQSSMMTQKVLDGTFNLVGNFYKLTEYNGQLYRSSWEVEMAKQLDYLDLPFQYEPFTVRYAHPSGAQKLYRPDFYLPMFHLILEVHPYPLIDEIMICKAKACFANGYNFLFVSESPWEFDPREHLSSSTTIESLSMYLRDDSGGK